MLEKCGKWHALPKQTPSKYIVVHLRSIELPRIPWICSQGQTCKWVVHDKERRAAFWQTTLMLLIFFCFRVNLVLLPIISSPIFDRASGVSIEQIFPHLLLFIILVGVVLRGVPAGLAQKSWIRACTFHYLGTATFYGTALHWKQWKVERHLSGPRPLKSVRIYF